MNSLGPSTTYPVKKAKVQALLGENKNGFCADCGMTLTIDTAWAVLSYGILVCDDCKLVHIQQENHYKSVDPSNDSETVAGILPTSIAQHWDDKDIEKIKANGNEKVNDKLLYNVPAWQYRPTATDGIKHKEYWINYKYGNRLAEGEEIPKTAGKSFVGIQFTRPMPKCNFPCCAVLQNNKLYLTSDTKNEEIPVENIETVLLNSKRIGRENGVQLTYRTNGALPHDGVTYTYLQHDNMETVLDWINLVLYTKYNLLRNKYSSCSLANIAKMLNCAVVKESYMTAGRGLVYVSLSEARIACFQHHLDEKPLFHLPISKAMKLSGTQYLDAVAHFFNMDISKIYGYEEWNKCLDYALGLDKLEFLADEIVKPMNSLHLLPKSKSATLSTSPIENEAGGDTVAPPKAVAEEDEILPANPERHVSGTSETAAFKDDRGNFGQVSGPEKPVETPAKKYECYPPIGPMGEMGKVARGELPPEAIKPPPPKADFARAQLYGAMSSMNPAMSMPPSTHSMLGSQSVVSLNASMVQPGMQTSTDCYPPISGPMRDMMKPTDMFHPPGRMQRDDNYPVIDEFKPLNSFSSGTFRPNDRGFGAKASFSESDMNSYARMASNNGWVGVSENILTVPWKQTRNGFEPARAFGQASGPLESWNEAKHGGSAEWQMKQSHDQFFGLGKPMAQRSINSVGHEQVIMDNLQQQWVSAERKLLALIHNGYVPASNMTAAGLDADSIDHAQTCIAELFDLLWKKRYDLALSFLRGFREVFSRSLNAEIRNRFIGVGELDTMRQIFLQQGRDKFVKASTSSQLNWKHPSPSPTFEHNWQNMPASAHHESPSDIIPWGPLSPNITTPVDVSPPNVWGTLPGAATSRSGSGGSDPWTMAADRIATTQAVVGANSSQPFNRAPSRPVSLARSSFSESSPNDGCFGSKASSESASPGVITPPSTLDTCMTSAALTGIETTLKNLFLNSNASGSTLWN